MTQKVFVTYAHDSQAHKDDVLLLATLLEESGVHVELDQWADTDRQDWSTWAIGEMTSADRVVVVVSPQYKAAVDGNGPAELNRGVRSEAAVLRDLQHGDRHTWLPKLLPVVLPGHAIEEIPYFLQPYSASHYLVEEISEQGIEELLRVITGQPGRVRPARGPVPVLPPVPNPAPSPGPAATALPAPLVPTWRSDLNGPGRTPSLEVHLIPVGDHQRIKVGQLAPLANRLASLGRSSGLFDDAESLAVDSSDEVAWAVSSASRKSSGLVVHRTGQRSAWSGLPHGQLGAVLIREDVEERLADLIVALLSLDLAPPLRFAPAVGLEPLSLVRIGTAADLTANSGRLHPGLPAHVRVPAEEAYTAEHLRGAVDQVAEELAAHLIEAFRRVWR
ncbi:MAG: SEFIR domain-containing protein [Umezawaea sp.]